MGQQERELGNLWRAIVLGDIESRYAIMSGVVLPGVSEADMDCTVRLTGDDDDEQTGGVTLNVSLQNTTGIYGIPAAGADCLVLEVDGKGKWELLRASAYTAYYIVIGGERMKIANGKVILNGGDKGGVPISSNTVERLNLIENDLNALKGLLTTLTGALSSASSSSPGTPVVNSVMSGYFSPFGIYAAAALNITSVLNIENQDVKQ